MGTNFYLYDKAKNEYKYENHIGKRSAAGWYCWDCGVTLCKDGEAGIHLGGRREDKYHAACPRCGRKKPRTEDLDESAAGRELGFNESPYRRKKGVATCSSFTWAMDEKELEKAIKRGSKKSIVDEYGARFSAKEFREMLKECPVRYFHSIGKEFS